MEAVGWDEIEDKPVLDAPLTVAALNLGLLWLQDPEKP